MNGGRSFVSGESAVYLACISEHCGSLKIKLRCMIDITAFSSQQGDCEDKFLHAMKA